MTKIKNDKVKPQVGTKVQLSKDELKAIFGGRRILCW
jgi:hypothetical protein